MVLLSLDGAGFSELERLRAAGIFGSAGFERFFRDGQVAALEPAEPALTAPSHVVIATGYPASRTGLISNELRRVGTDLLVRQTGFSIPIETETLWEAARRQGQTVGILTWPGADGNGPRRHGDWGLVYVNEASHGPLLAAIDPASWQDSSAGQIADLPTSFSPPRRASWTVPARRADQAAERFELVALDRRDDQSISYDTLVIRRQAADAAAGVTWSSPPLAVGEWVRAPSTATGDGLSSGGAWLEVHQLAMDLAEVEIYYGGHFATSAYPPAFAELLARRNIAWPGPAFDRALLDPARGGPAELATWTTVTARFARFFMDALLVSLAEAAPTADLVMAYSPVIDEAGHGLTLVDPRQAGYHPERAANFKETYTEVWREVDRQLARLLGAVDLDTTAVVVVADHGMLPAWSAVHPNVVLRQLGYLELDTNGRIVPSSLRAYATTSGALAHVYVNLAGREPAGLVQPADRAAMVATIERELLALRDEDGKVVVQRVVDRQDLGRYGLDHPSSGDLVVWASPGFAMSWDPRPEEPIRPATVTGQHGYPATDRAMAASYLAIGKGVAPGVLPGLHATEVATRVAALLGIEPPRPQPAAP